MFLERLATYIVEHHSSQLEKKCFVFPNRRSGLFFKRFLIKQTTKVTWAPEIITINELIEQFVGLNISDPIDLLFEIYDIYNEVTSSPVSFDQYFPWGEMMIKDFDTIDKYLVDHSSIFQNIHDIKEIEDKFGSLTEEQIAFIRKFWLGFFEGDTTNEKEQFLTIWEILPKVYERLNHQLRQKGEGYEGMLYREAAGLNEAELSDLCKYDHYYFVGFNALSISEKKLFRILQRSGRASFFWDYDVLYRDNESMEAGFFIRENLKQFPPPDDLNIFSSFTGKPDIRIFDLPSDILQSKTVHGILNERFHSDADPNDTAVVLCDENLMLPILFSLPDSVEEINVTMGYPFNNTPLYSFLKSILNLHRHARHAKNNTSGFYHKDVLSVLNHEYFRIVISDRNKHNDDSEANCKVNLDIDQDIKEFDAKNAVNQTDELIRKLKKYNYVYVHDTFFNDSFSRLVFRRISDINDFCSYLDEIIAFLLNSFVEEDDGFRRKLDKEYLLLFHNRLSKLADSFLERKDIDYDTFIRFLLKMMAGLKIPMAGEPLSGLQIMGILETRLLDFRHVIMLSVNEEIMPGTANIHSFIPYGLRFAFGLPTRDEMDAIYAYYFYRLIQRAEKIDLLYKSDSEGTGTGEMSRYLYQMKYQYKAQVIRPVMPVVSSKMDDIRISKTEQVIDKLERFAQGNESTSYLSPSALNTYMTCSLKFYFRKVLGIGEQDSLLEEVDPIGFGNILHHALYDVYDTYIDSENVMQADKLRGIAKTSEVDILLEHRFREEYFKTTDKREIEGRNVIIFSILKKYLLKVIEEDIKLAPFTIESLEKEYSIIKKINTFAGIKEIKIGGKIDRIDRVSGITRIIDYKTGSAATKLLSVESMFNRQDNKRSKEAFQAFLYAHLYSEKHPEKIVQPGLYVIKELFKEDYKSYFTLKEPVKEPVHDFNKYAKEFKVRLQAILEEIYNPEIPFERTTEPEHCRYCEFKSICRRN